MVFHVAFVQPERKLIDVAGQMLGAGVVIDADLLCELQARDALACCFAARMQRFMSAWVTRAAVLLMVAPWWWDA